MEKKVALNIVGLSYSQTQTGAYALILGDDVGKRRLPIIIGNFEAQAIAIELEKMKPSRPLTHDVFFTVADRFDVKLKEVIIYNLVEGVFYAKLILDNGVKEEEIDARSSDAIALAVRFKCPIYAYEFIMSQAGISIEEEEAASQTDVTSAGSEPKQQKEGLNALSISELETKLDKAIEEEDYELASKLRDEIDRRHSN
ncbi:bifunctional nuclease family protein [Salibacter sp.]|jgi:bifunctional DNase/RNase|uniref:bifunctional nuclease family protein n=1 Tax=Salibacter sp. TaxID=2010995 RepID=UPI0028704E8F|nr:bifunctional nuclease family protein [Salibacter sp.]MDR9397815.1 bifunctional nuclease family protein [Salibacter sp.]MDR9487102.1 bifunctional nuclease family protein [Salibacter sp.]